MPNTASTKKLTLCIARTDSAILLAMKKRGFGEGRWNGFGGKVAKGETAEKAARRECLEEGNIAVSELIQRGVLEFVFEGDPVTLEVHIFEIMSFTGEPQETEEMRPQWFALENIPFDDMWPDDEYWIPLFLAGKKFRGKFVFSPDHRIVDSALEEIPDVMQAQ